MSHCIRSLEGCRGFQIFGKVLTILINKVKHNIWVIFKNCPNSIGASNYANL